MKVAEKYSHLNGLEFLLVHKKKLWKEILGAIAGVDASTCRTKLSKEKRMKGKLLYAPKDMNAKMRNKLEVLDWEQRLTSYWVTKDAVLIRRTMHLTAAEQKVEIERAGLQPLRSYNQTDFVKDRVAVEVQFGKYSFVAYDLFVKHMAFFVGDVIDVGIEVLPMKALQAQMSSGVAYYEGELYNLLRQGRGVPAVPLVLIGVVP